MIDKSRRGHLETPEIRELEAEFRRECEAAVKEAAEFSGEAQQICEKAKSPDSKKFRLQNMKRAIARA